MTNSIQPVEVKITDEFFSDLRGWLAAKTTSDMTWLLVHADDGHDKAIL